MTTDANGSVIFERVRKAYGSFAVIPDLSLTIEPGTLVTLLGPSGCGKTTTLRMLAGLEHPTSGKIMIGGKDVTMLPANERDVSMVFQSYALFPHMTIGDNVAYGLESSGLRKADAREKAAHALGLVGLKDLDHRLPAELSGGQQQRAAVARSLVLEPQVLLLDEPLSNLDARLRRKVRTEIRELQQRLGFTAVYVTHDQEEALAVSDQIIIMKEGGIAQKGSLRDLFETPASSFVADFMGEANVLSCLVAEATDNQAVVEIEGLRHCLNARNPKRGLAKLAVRPNAIKLTVGGEAGTFLGKVLHSAYLGNHVEYEIETKVGTLYVVDSDAQTPMVPSTDVTIALKNHGVALISDVP